MKSIGIVRKIDPLGRIVLPKEIRKVYDIKEGDSLEIFVDKESIILKKYTPACIFCEEAKDTSIVKGKLICKTCREELRW
ncbi:MAG: AbrB family transcriptional regulator, transcriptional pleiotropic regulator of transition state [Epulopiscium sp.]|jgi:transcriptional pleiotropic regulator of transition state genes|nr:abrB [Thermoanaerobacter sp.]MDK2788986.1 AbrB family transcriptional regulator, transcriptional pleiotropic regulator of transition state [Candidatus Epulonipiscium sp.]